MRKKTSPIWKMDSKAFKELVENSVSYTQILKYFGYSGTGGSGVTLRERIKKENIDCSHILKNNKGRNFLHRKAISLNKVMIKNSTYSRGFLKKRLLKDGILQNRCEICGLQNKWQGQEIVMILDHINGINNDHRLENLRMLCPNCNSQTITFAGRTQKKKYNCNKCGAGITKHSKHGLCQKCASKLQRKAERPSEEILLEEIAKTSYCAVGRKYGVSDNAIRKWIKNS